MDVSYCWKNKIVFKNLPDIILGVFWGRDVDLLNSDMHVDWPLSCYLFFKSYACGLKLGQQLKDGFDVICLENRCIFCLLVS